MVEAITVDVVLKELLEQEVGCTHIGTRNGTLAQYGNTSGLYLVAGGGGGGFNNSALLTGGNGGGSNGGNGSGSLAYGDHKHGLGGTQSGGYSFGKGADSSPRRWRWSWSIWW